MKLEKKETWNLKKIEDILSKYDGERPGVAAVAVKTNKIVYENYVGMANLEYKLPVTKDTAFNLASVSKPITAMGVMILREGGDLAYDDDVTTYFPELGHYCQGVTIRHLLSHTSGIINYYRILDRLDMSDLHLTNSTCYDLLTKEGKLLFEPGEKFDYSNSNYVLLALLIEKISNKTFNSFLQEKLFKPLGMTHAKVFNESQPIIESRAYGYGIKEGKFHCDYIGPLTTGDGCIFASAEDLVLINKALYEEKILRRESIEEAFTSGILKDGTKAGYGFGWETHRSTGKLRRLHHSGSDHGATSLITTFPKQQLTVILLANSDDFTWEDRLNITEAFIDCYEL